MISGQILRPGGYCYWVGEQYSPLSLFLGCQYPPLASTYFGVGVAMCYIASWRWCFLLRNLSHPSLFCIMILLHSFTPFLEVPIHRSRLVDPIHGQFLSITFLKNPPLSTPHWAGCFRAHPGESKHFGSLTGDQTAKDETRFHQHISYQGIKDEELVLKEIGHTFWKAMTLFTYRTPYKIIGGRCYFGSYPSSRPP